MDVALAVVETAFEAIGTPAETLLFQRLCTENLFKRLEIFVQIALSGYNAFRDTEPSAIGGFVMDNDD